MKLRTKLDKILKEYIAAFEKKHDCEFDFAVQDNLMDVICFDFSDYFSMFDIVYDIDNDLPKGLIFEWAEANLDNQEKGIINLHSYAKGLRHKDLTNTIS